MNTWLKRLATVGSVALLAACQSIPQVVAPVSAEPVKPAPVAEATQTVSDKSKAGLLAPMIERRDTLVATGYAVISVQNHKNPAQQRLLAIRAAKLDAYRALTEQVYGQHLDATTTVSDMTVMSDTFRARVEGVVYGAVLVSITPAGDDTYEATLSLDRSVVNDLRALYLGQLVSSR
ncbi:Lipoprotein LPP20-like [Burkholderiaceae bacterium]